MAITLNVYYQGTDGAAERFVEEMESSGTAAFVRAEEGNLCYDYYAPMNGSHRVLLVEKWQSRQALSQHQASPVMEKITALREKWGVSRELELFET